MTQKGFLIQKSVLKFRLELYEIYEVIMLYECAFLSAYVRETHISLILNFSGYLPKYFMLFLSHFK
jgi:hypothetical protein